MINKNFFPHFKAISLRQILEMANIDLEHNPTSFILDALFTGVSKIEHAQSSDISVFHNKQYAQEAKESKAGLIITSPELAQHLTTEQNFITVSNPYRLFAKIIAQMNANEEFNQSSIHPSCMIAETASLGKNCIIGPFVFIGPNVTIGDNAKIDSGVSIGESVIIGNNATIFSNVSISHCTIGNNVVIKPGARIGQSGFGFNMDDQGPFDVPHVGIVQIGHNVQIGANTCIDRGSIGNTIIHNGVRIDNLVQIAHNVEVGENSIIVSQTGIAGSTQLGKFVITAGQVGIAGHLKIGNFVKIAAQSGIMRNIDDNLTVAGSPAVSVHEWHRQTIALKNLIKKKN